MPYAQTSLRADKRALRDKMRALGLGYQEIAAEFARRYRLRPRAAWREAYGWSLKDAAARINAYTGEVGLDPGGIAAMTGSHLCEHENWPGGGPSPAGRRPSPYLLALLASVYGCAVLDLIDLDDRDHLPPADLLILHKYGQNQPQSGSVSAPVEQQPPQPRGVVALTATERHQSSVIEVRPVKTVGLTSATGHARRLPPPVIAYRRIETSDSGDAWLEHEVQMAAHEGSDHAEGSERRDIGEATLEQLRADVIRLARDYEGGETLPAFREMRTVRGRIYAALDRRLWPRDATELYLLVGCLNGLMAAAAKNLGFPQAAEELIRAGWAYATAIDHRPLMAWLRMDSAYIAYWSDRPRQSRDLALSGLEYLRDGQNAAQCHLYVGLAAARLGDAVGARYAITAAHEARERDHRDELLEIGGEFGFSLAAQHYYAGFTLIELPQAETEAIAELERSAELYAAGPEPGENHSYRCEAQARIDLTTARLRIGQLDAAAAAAERVLSLPPGKRVDTLPERFRGVRAELARPRYRASPQARDLDERIEEFCRESIGADLHDLATRPN